MRSCNPSSAFFSATSRRRGSMRNWDVLDRSFGFTEFVSFLVSRPCFRFFINTILAEVVKSTMAAGWLGRFARQKPEHGETGFTDYRRYFTAENPDTSLRLQPKVTKNVSGFSAE